MKRGACARVKLLTRETPAHVRITGSLRIAWSDEELEDCRAQLHAMQADGLPAEWYEGAEGSGLLFPHDGVFQPLSRCRALARAALSEGADLFEGTPAVAITGECVQTPLGTIRCNRVVVAVDGALARVLPELQNRVRTARLQMLATAPLPSIRFTRPVYARYGYEYWQQLPDRRLAIGGYRDHFIEAEWTTDATPTDGIQSLLELHLRNILKVDQPVVQRWAASVGYTDDLLPVFEEVRPAVWAVGAYSGTGNVLGAACGRAAMRCAAGERQQLYELLART